MSTASKGTIFINYRRADSKLVAQLIFNELLSRFTREQVFKDFNTISPGDDYTVSIDKALGGCDVLLVLIGEQWLNITDDAGHRRLDDPADYVRVEIAKALSRNIKVIPVMLDGVKMPRAEQLPEDIQSLTRRQTVDIDTNARLEQDVDRLADIIKDILSKCYPDPPKPPDNGGGGQQSGGQGGNYRPENTVGMPAPPANNMVWGIIAVFLCWPFAIASIINANKVDKLYREGKYADAQAAADAAKKYGTWALIAGGIWWLYVFIHAANGGGYSGN